MPRALAPVGSGSASPACSASAPPPAARSGSPARRLVDDVARDVADEVVQRAAAAAQQRSAADPRRGSAASTIASTPRRARLVDDRLAGAAGAHGGRRHLDAHVLLPHRLRPRQRPPRLLELVLGQRARPAAATSGSGTPTAPRSPRPSLLVRALVGRPAGPAVWTMSSSSGVPRSGTRIEPYSASVALLRSARRGWSRAEQRLALGRAVDDVEREPERHPAEPGVSAPPRGSRGRRSSRRDDSTRAEHGGQRQRPARTLHGQRHPYGRRGRLAVAQHDDGQVGEREASIAPKA